MTKIMCDCIMCEHNPSHIYGTYGECTREELKVEDEEFYGTDEDSCEPEWFDKCVCQGFKWQVGKVIMHKDKEVKIDAND